MWEWLSNLVDPSDFPARWVCGNWTDLHGWIHIISDLMIWAAYTAIPCTLAYFIAKRKDLVFPRIFWLFCLFIFSCGTVHLIEAILFWYPVYRVSAIVKVITAMVSWISVIALWQVTPKALSLPGLAVVNKRLKDEIEERKKITEDLHQSQDRLRLALLSSHAGVWSRDLKSNQLFWDQTVYQMFEFDEAESQITYESFIHHIHPDDRTTVQFKIDESIRNNQPYKCEFRIIRKDGSIRHILSTGTVYFDEHHEPALFTGITSDITDQKTNEERQRALDEKLQQAQKLESLGILAGGIAHDFNNLLVGVLGNASLASVKLTPSSPVKENLEQIEKAAKRASELTKQMLAFSGKGKFQITSIQLNELIVDISTLMKVAFKENTGLILNLAPSLPLIEGDHSQITQILMNLITNASDAIEDRTGTITISTNVMHCGKNYLDFTIFPKELVEGQYVTLEVSDTGKGMDKETLPKIFDPFYTTKFIGRGLGLAAVLGIVHGHHGAIRVYSEVGKGTTFKLFFPVSEKEELPVEAKPTEKDIKITGGKILIVDDEETIHKVLNALLIHIGFGVYSAGSGEEALKVYQRHQNEIGIVILDLTMPGMGGEEVFCQLRQINPDVKVIVSSGYNEQEVVVRFAGKGLTGFIQKPYTLEALKEALAKVQ